MILVSCRMMPWPAAETLMQRLAHFPTFGTRDCEELSDNFRQVHKNPLIHTSAHVLVHARIASCARTFALTHTRACVRARVHARASESLFGCFLPAQLWLLILPSYRKQAQCCPARLQTDMQRLSHTVLYRSTAKRHVTNEPHILGPHDMLVYADLL